MSGRAARRLRRVLGSAAAGAALALVPLTIAAAREHAALGRVGGPLVCALAFGTLLILLTPVAATRTARATAEDARPFFTTACYARILAWTFFAALLAVVFGSRSEIGARLAAHGIGVAAAHVLLLCVPSVPRALVAAIEERPLLRGVDVVLTNVMVALVAGELALRAALLLQGGALPWSFDAASFEDRKLHAPLFGLPPNEEGYNDRPFDTAPNGAGRRVAAVGDSFFVAQVPRPLGVIARAEARLRERRPGIEIYNFGIVATSPSDYVEIARRDALRHAPDVLMVGLYVGNDIAMPRARSPLEKRSMALYRLARSLRRALAARDLSARGDFVDLATLAADDPRWSVPGALPPVAERDAYLTATARFLEEVGPPRSARREREWHAVLDALDDLDALACTRDIPLWLAILPDPAQVSAPLRDEVRVRRGLSAPAADLDYPQRRLLTHCEAHGWRCLDLLPDFRDAPDPDALHLVNDYHWSPSGNALAAELLASWIDRGLGGPAAVASTRCPGANAS